MPDDGEQSFRVDYVYGPYVGRRRIFGPTLKKATANLWEEMARTMWVVSRFRIVKELKEDE